MLLGRYVNKYYLRYWYLFLIGALALIAVDWIQLYIPEYLGNIVDLLTDDYVASEVLGQVGQLSLNVLYIALGMMAGRILWRLTIFNASKRIEADLRQKMFEKAEKLSRDYYHENKVGTVMAWFTTDVETIEEYFSWGTIMLTDAIFLSILVVVKMLMLDVLLSIIAFIPLIFIIIWGALVENVMSKKWASRQAAFDRLYDFSEENFTGIRVIKAFVKERSEIRAFAKVAKDNEDVNVKFVRISIAFDIVIELLIAVILCVLMAFGGYCVYLTTKGLPLELFGQSFEMNIKAGKLIQFFGYFDTIIWPMIALGQIVTMKARAKASLKRITRFLDTPEDIKSKENAVILDNVKGKITFKNFTFRFKDGEEDALKNVSFEILPGEKVGIVGKIGCGKTTIANILCRYFNVNEGQVFIDDIDLMDADVASIHRAVSYVPQDYFLFSDTVQNNIAFGKAKASFTEIEDAAKFANISQDIKSFTNGYETITGERGVSLSGGQKQRISIARAFLQDAPIMILDDSVSAVDVSTEEAILKNIEEQRNGKTTIVVASRVSTVAHFDKILVLNNGEVEAFDSPKNLLKTSEAYKRMVKSQKLEQEVEGGK